MDATVSPSKAGPLVLDGEGVELHDAVLVARSDACEPFPVLASSDAGVPFDRAAAAASLAAIAAEVTSCKAEGGPSGEGHAIVIFSPNGSVASARVDGRPFAGTAIGGCVTRMFRAARVPPFTGQDVPIRKRFVVGN
jgi:hypothetical protein